MPDHFFIKNGYRLLQTEYAKMLQQMLRLLRLCIDKFTEKKTCLPQYRNTALCLTPPSPWTLFLHPRNRKFPFRFNQIIDEPFDYYQGRSIIGTSQSVLIKLRETI